MSNKLYKLGLWAFTHRWWVLGAWVAVLIATISLMSAFQQPSSDSFTIPGTESQKAFDQLEKSMPEAAGGSGRIVFAAPEGKQIADYKTVIDKTLERVMKVDDVALAISPLESGTISQNGRIAFAQVQLDVGPTEVGEELSEDINTALSETARKSGLQAEVGGDIGQAGPGEILGMGEIIGVAVAAVTLFITLGTLIGAGMPLLVALLGVGIGVTTIFSLGSLVDVNTVTPILAIMLGLAVGIDYALFIITRHRKYVLENTAPHLAAARAISTAGNAVIFAALTVVIALAALAVTGIPFVATMGLAAAGTVAIAAAVAVTLVPALLGFAGLKILSKRERRLRDENKGSETPRTRRKKLGYKWGSLITRRPLLPIVISVVVLVVIALPLQSLHLGFPSDGDLAKDSSPRKAYDLLTEGFGPGFNGPLLLVAELPAGLSQEEAQSQLGEIAERVGKIHGIANVIPAAVAKDGRTAILQATPTTGPTDATTKNLVTELRENSATLAGQGSTLAVTGSTAMTIDIDNKLASALPKYLGVVVGLSLLILIMVFRSIIVPLKATLGFLLTIAATLGALVVFFQWGWFGLFDPIPIVSFLPIIVTGILFGLAMDYEFFLVSGMHETFLHSKRKDPKIAVVDGFAHGSKVVTAAAIIMISVFSGFIMSSEQMVQMIGFALAFGILVDAFVVRMTIVPAVMALCGKAAWWIPDWLGKILPNVSIEGDETTFNESLKQAKKEQKKRKKQL